MTLRRAWDNLWDLIAANFRARRKRRFLSKFPAKSTIIDIGGLVRDWNGDARNVTVLNLMQQTSDHCNVLVADGRSTNLPDKSFELAYSNSVIEHVGGWEDQVALAAEIRRIGNGVYCQTPNLWFPVEVHYRTLFLHWYPNLLRNYFFARFLTAWGLAVKPDRKQVLEYRRSIKLLSYSKMRRLFPDCIIEREKFMGMTKSLIAVRPSHCVNASDRTGESISSASAGHRILRRKPDSVNSELNSSRKGQ